MTEEQELLCRRIMGATCNEHIINATHSYMKAIRGDRFNFLVQQKDFNFPDSPVSKVIAQFASERDCLCFVKWFGQQFKESIKLGLFELYAIDMDKSLIMKIVSKDNLEFI